MPGNFTLREALEDMLFNHLKVMYISVLGCQAYLSRITKLYSCTIADGNENTKPRIFYSFNVDIMITNITFYDILFGNSEPY